MDIRLYSGDTSSMILPGPMESAPGGNIYNDNILGPWLASGKDSGGM